MFAYSTIILNVWLRALNTTRCKRERLSDLAERMTEQSYRTQGVKEAVTDHFKPIHKEKRNSVKDSVTQLTNSQMT